MHVEPLHWIYPNVLGLGALVNNNTIAQVKRSMRVLWTGLG